MSDHPNPPQSRAEAKARLEKLSAEAAKRTAAGVRAGDLK